MSICYVLPRLFGSRWAPDQQIGGIGKTPKITMHAKWYAKQHRIQRNRIQKKKQSICAKSCVKITTSLAFIDWICIPIIQFYYYIFTNKLLMHASNFLSLIFVFFRTISLLVYFRWFIYSWLLGIFVKWIPMDACIAPPCLQCMRAGVPVIRFR